MLAVSLYPIDPAVSVQGGRRDVLVQPRRPSCTLSGQKSTVMQSDREAGVVTDRVIAQPCLHAISPPSLSQGSPSRPFRRGLLNAT